MYETITMERSLISRRQERGSGFTLIEVLLALSLFLVLLAVVFVPLNNAFQIFNAGRTSIALQGAADSTVKSIAADLQGAVVVYPNTDIPGITDRAPYSNSGISKPPYFADTVCSATRMGNTSRIDFLLPSRSSGSVDNPLKPDHYIVTYYARRFDTSAPYDKYSKPMGIFRSQMPYEDSTSTPVTKLYTDAKRYNSCSTADIMSKWLVQSSADAPNLVPSEPQISPYTTNLDDTNNGVPGGDSLVSPRDMGLEVDTSTMQPNVTFQCEDTDSNGIIDRVLISLTLVQYEEGNSGRNGNPGNQRVTATQTVNLANTKFGV